MILFSSDNVDRKALEELFNEYDTDKTGRLTIDEFEILLAKLGVAPMKDPFKKRPSASVDAAGLAKE